jgi:tetratricopeptide (TPR) repeat protein
MRIGELDSAEKLALQGLDLSRRTEDRKNRVWLKTIMGIIAIKRGCIKEAISHLKNAVKLADPAEERWLFFRATVHLKRAQFLRNRSGSALDGIRELVASVQAAGERAGEVESLKEEEVVAEANIVLAKCLKEMGRKKQAREHEKRALALIEQYKLYSLKRELR